MNKKTIFSFLIAAFLGQFSEGIFNIVCILLLTKLGSSYISIGYMFVLIMLPSVFIQPITGPLIDSKNKAKLSALLAFIRGIFIALIPIWKSFFGSSIMIIYVSIFVSYIMYHLLSSTNDSMMSELANGKNQKITEMIAAMQGALQVGLLSSALIAGFLTQIFNAYIPLVISAILYFASCILLLKEFNHLFIFNLRGNARTQGEQRRKEKDNVFGQGTRTPIAISILVKDGSNSHEIYYHDIGDYLTRKQKLNLIRKDSSINGVDWKKINPDINNDWINQRDPNYQKYSILSAKGENSVFRNNAMGVLTSRDAWVYGFSKNKVKENVTRLIDNYNKQLGSPTITNRNPKDINWSRKLEKKFKKI